MHFKRNLNLVVVRLGTDAIVPSVRKFGYVANDKKRSASLHRALGGHHPRNRILLQFRVHGDALQQGGGDILPEFSTRKRAV